MGFRVRKSIKIAPGVKLNINKKSVSVTAGRKGIHHTVSSTGKRSTTVGIPGTGISYTSTSSAKKKSSSSHSSTVHTSSRTSCTPGLYEEIFRDANKPPKTPWYMSKLCFRICKVIVWVLAVLCILLGVATLPVGGIGILFIAFGIGLIAMGRVFHLFGGK